MKHTQFHKHSIHRWLNAFRKSEAAVYTMPVLLFVAIAAAYFWWTWSAEVGSLMGDEFLYLFAAEHYSPWLASSPVASYHARTSVYPPLYPFLLGLFGAGTNVLLAHIVTTALLLLAFIALFVWIRVETGSTRYAAMLTFVFAILPGTYMHALWILSEHLFLLLSLSCLCAVALSENQREPRFLLLASACVAAAVLTRSAGLALLVAFAAYVLLHRTAKPWLLIAIASLPPIAWGLFRAITLDTQDAVYGGYLALLVERLEMDSFGSVVRQIASNADALASGLFLDVGTSSTLTPFFWVLGALFIAGTLYRAYLKKLDGLYALAYGLMLLTWPFHAEAPRFAFVVVPVLMLQGFIFGRDMLLKLRRRSFDLPFRLTYVCVMALMALPALGLAAMRVTQAVPQELKAVRPFAWWEAWYFRHELSERTLDLSFYHALSRGLHKFSEFVPEIDCIYSVKTVFVSFYTERVSKFPPREGLDSTQFRDMLQRGGCRYFVFLSMTTPELSNASFYPVRRLADSVSAIAKIEIRSVEDSGTATVGILATFDADRLAD